MVQTESRSEEAEDSYHDEDFEEQKGLSSDSYCGKRNGWKPSKAIWTEDEDRRLFILYKSLGSKWSLVAKELPGRSENEVKNRFYSTLRRIATKKSQGSSSKVQQRKATLLQYVDDAIEYGHSCSSKRGRKKKQSNSPRAEEASVFKPFPVSPKPCLPVASNSSSFMPFQKTPSQEYTAHTTHTDQNAKNGLEPVQILAAFHKLMTLQNNCINLLRQQVAHSIGSGQSAFVPYNRKHKFV